MNVKLKIETVKLACAAVVFETASLWLYFFSTAACLKIIAAFLAALFIFSLVGIAIMFYEYRKYLRVEDKLWYVGSNVAHKAKKLYELHAVDLYLMFAPAEDVQRFKDVFAAMEEEDFFYGEMRYVVSKIK